MKAENPTDKWLEIIEDNAGKEEKRRESSGRFLLTMNWDYSILAIVTMFKTARGQGFKSKKVFKMNKSVI